MGQELLAQEFSAYLKANGFDDTEAGLSPEEREQRRNDYNALMNLGATLAGAAVGALIDGTQGAATAATAATEGVRNNYLSHEEDERRHLVELACANGSQAACKEYEEWNDIDTTHDADFKEACGNGQRNTPECFFMTFDMLAYLGTYAQRDARDAAIDVTNSDFTQAHREEMQSYLDLLEIQHPGVRSSTEDKVRNPANYDGVNAYGVIKAYGTPLVMKFGTEALAVADLKNAEDILQVTDLGARNGMQNNPDYAAALMLTHVDAMAYTKNAVENEKRQIPIPYQPIDRYVLFYAPELGFAQDILDAGLTKLGIEGEAVTSLRGFMEDIQSVAQKNGQTFNLVAHSRGGPEVVQAFSGSQVSDFRNIAVVFHAGANNQWVTNSVMANNGLKDVSDDKNRYRDSPYDPVPQIVGLRALSSPLSLPNFFMSILSAPLLFSGPETSPHTLPYKWPNLQKE